ncbi:RluA family pseudouridine synthase [Paenibacillus yanchengensis]|uniref:Pseudouridine synthase n=1 Tax=Paenibacillus yanchengensis TaxID=2035833 RepID=A0ABW4YL50_9BACL
MNSDIEKDEQYGWVVSQEEAGERLDKWLLQQLDDPAYSRTQVQEWIKSGAVTVNQITVKSNYKTNASDQIELELPEPESLEIEAEDIPLDVLYEDADVIVINKIRGMVVHPAVGHRSGTVVNALLHHCKDLSGINGVMRPGIVHRIDKDTSGLMMAAKNDLAHLSLTNQLKEHTVIRKYIAIVHGNISHHTGTIDAPIGRDQADRKKFVVTDKNSKHAITHFAVIERLGDYSVVELQLETGRTHQIRVHMKYIGHPLVGDPQYGLAKAKGLQFKGQALHAVAIGFVHPRSEEKLLFDSELPADMKYLLQQLRSR